MLDTLLPRLLKPLPADTKDEGESAAAAASTLVEPPMPAVTYLNANQVLVTSVTYLGLILTYGAAFPPLALALAVTLVIVACYDKLVLGRFLNIAIAQQQPQYREIIELECKGVGSGAVLQNFVWMLVTASFWFYTLFLFDTLGGAVGFKRSYWVLIVVPLLPACIYVTFATAARYHRYENSRKVSINHTNDVGKDNVSLEMIQLSSTVN